MLSPRLSVSLDAIRTIAAFYIVFHHIAPIFIPAPFNLLFRLGQEAVIVFFLLSGFLIHANERARSLDYRGYASRRVLRIYPTLILAMFVSVAVAGYDGDLLEKFRWSEVLCNLAGLQDVGSLKPGTICSPFMNNGPLWSLSYELVFYLIYPIVLPFFLKRPGLAQHFIGLSSVALIFFYVSLPNHFFLLPSYFLIWWCGAMMAEAYLRGTKKLWPLAVPVGYLAIATGCWAIVAINSDEVFRVGTYPFLNLRHFAVALLCIIISVALAYSSLGHHFLNLFGTRFVKGWVWLSSISYGVYILHTPILRQWSVADSVSGFIFALVILIITAYLFDNRVNFLIRKIRRRKR